MPGSTPDMIPLRLAPQRALFGVEFRDPIRGSPIGEGLRVTAEGMRPPTLTPSKRFVWLDRDPPVERRIRVKAVSTNGMFAPFEELFRVPAHVGDVKPAALLFRRRLRPTGLYEPPEGMIAVAGMLVESRDSREPVPGVRVRIQFHYAEGLETFRGGYTAFTDAKGRFAAVVRCLGEIRPDPARHDPTAFEAWLWLKREGGVRITAPLPLRFGRLSRLAEPLNWAALTPLEGQRR